MRRIAIGFVAAAMVFAACGGSSKSSSAGSGSGSTTAGGSGGGSATTSGGNSGGGNDGGNSNISTANIKVSFTETDSTDPTSKTTLTFGQNGKGKTFFTSVDPTDTTSPATTIYYDGKTAVDCEGTGSTAHCTAVPEAQAGLVTGLATAFTALGGVVKEIGGGHKSSENIAGRDAQCYKFNARDAITKLANNPIFKNSDAKASDYDANDTVSVCVDKKTGFPLKFSGTKKGAPESELTATAVGEPSDSDFTPPVTPATVPSGSVPVTSAP